MEGRSERPVCVPRQLAFAGGLREVRLNEFEDEELEVLVGVSLSGPYRLLPGKIE